MSQLNFEVIGSRPEPYHASPTLSLQLRITETTGARLHAIALRCQVQIEPRRRRYSHDEEERLLELFGEPRRWSETLQTIVWAQVPLMVQGFTGRTEVDLPLICTYDFEVGSAKYLQALDHGEIPIRVLFSGTIFTKAAAGFAVEQVPWEKEAAFALPVPVLRAVMDRYFPDTAWIRLRRESFDALHRFRGLRALPTWEETIETLLREAKVGELS